MAARAIVPSHVVSRSFEQETLLLNLESGQYHGINATGGRLLELISDENSDGNVGAAVEQLAKECVMEPAEIDDDLARFCLELEERGLIGIDRPRSARARPGNGLTRLRVPDLAKGHAFGLDVRAPFAMPGLGPGSDGGRAVAVDLAAAADVENLAPRGERSGSPTTGR